MAKPFIDMVLLAALNKELDRFKSGDIIRSSQLIDALRFSYKLDATEEQMLAAIVALASTRGLFVKFDADNDNDSSQP